MDELVMEEKRYISSKRAAKITGYAKDYVGQLCREGRLPARLVGRNWYVLESAIQDHRFGTTEKKPESSVEQSAPAFLPTWESPRYEADEIFELPPISKDTPTIEDNSEVAQRLQDSWKEWFERIADTAIAPIASAVEEEPKKAIHNELLIEEKEPKAEETEAEEVSIPIRTIYRSLPREMPSFDPKMTYDKAEELYQKPNKRERKKGMVAMIQVVGAVLAVLVAILAAIGTGYFDGYFISDNRVGIMAGVLMYEK